MKKIIILIPVYNDWQSLNNLLVEINSYINDIKNVSFNCIIINDASTLPCPSIKVPSNISSIKLINMKENRGHARCNAFGIRYLAKKSNFDHLILMDGDGEDRPQEIKLLVKKALTNLSTSVVAKRVKRSEGPFFQFLYQLHKAITFTFTGKLINFGNYSCLTREDVGTISNKKSLWSSFSGTVKKYILNLNSINSERGTRYYGPSQMSLYKLGIHSLSIIAVFKEIVFLRSAIILILTSFFYNQVGACLIFFQIFLVIFNLLIYIVSFRENENELINSHNNEKSLKIYTH
tara:strand:+ start:1855 stop:2727 length:873 start_codon:yes stop_codon:yes gene_type:complete